MIGLTGLTDGGHVLEHPAGPLYVTVRRGKIDHAELAPWGEPDLVSWGRPLNAWSELARQYAIIDAIKGGGAAG